MGLKSGSGVGGDVQTETIYIIIIIISPQALSPGVEGFEGSSRGASRGFEGERMCARIEGFEGCASSPGGNLVKVPVGLGLTPSARRILLASARARS